MNDQSVWCRAYTASVIVHLLAVRLSGQAYEDLKWWLNVFRAKPQRPIRWAGGQAFLWHQKHENLESIRKLAWQDGILVVLYTDAAGDVGWGVSCGDAWQQGVWSQSDGEKSINWKELKAYELALTHLSETLLGKLILVKMDNTCAVHYVNYGHGRIKELADLAKTIRILELQMGCESVALHLPGERNVTADALSRMVVLTKSRDPTPHRTLRKRLFKHIEKVVGSFTIDGMADELGQNSLCPRYLSPSNSFFEADLVDEKIWLCPPLDLIYPTLDFLRKQFKSRKGLAIVMLLPEDTKAGWFWMLKDWSRIARYVKGSDVFREVTWSSDDNASVVRKLPSITMPWVVVSSMPASRLRSL